MAERQPIPTDPRFQDLTGRVFGNLTVLFYAGRQSGKYSLWHCSCQCGKETTIISSKLTLGRSKSCKHCFRNRPRRQRADVEDLTGQTFGRLTVVSLNRRNKTRWTTRAYWNCDCSCGEKVAVRGDSMKAGKILSCGCLSIARKWAEGEKPTHRKCRLCGETKPFTLEFFYRKPAFKWALDKKCRDCAKIISQKSNRRLAGKARWRCLTAYAGDPPKCQCPGCNETHVEFLTIDHIHGGGAEHRRSINGGSIYAWLIRHKFPEGFRVLCYNCNLSRGRYGYCPHCIDQDQG